MQTFAPQPLPNCHYCAQQFDAAQRSPHIICNNNHQICLQCLNSLRIPANCRVCRLPIDFSKIRLNKELVQILTNSKNISYVQQSQRAVNHQNNQVPTRQISYESNNAKVGAYSAYNDINTVNDQMQNNPPIPAPAQDSIPNKNSHQAGCTCYNCKYHQMIDGKSDWEFLWRLPKQKDFHFLFQYLFLIQLGMSIINFIIASTAQPSVCMDRKINGQSSLRAQYAFLFYIDLGLLIGILLFFILFHNRCILHQCFDSLVSTIFGLSLLKCYIWGAVQILTFFGLQSQVCNGGLYAYGLLTAIFHIPIVVAISIMACIHSRGNIRI